MLAYLMANWQNIAVAVLAVAEVIALFVPGAQGTVKTIITALTGLGVKDPKIGS
jgi:hypothetical protein